METYDHSDKTSTVGTIPYHQMSGGDLVKFDYQKPDSTDTRRVFVIEPQFEETLHGLDIQYLTEDEIIDLYRQTQEDMFDEATEEDLQADLPGLITADISDANSFYNNVIDGLNFGQNAYRTFKHENITSPIPAEIVYEATNENLLGNFEFYDSPES